MVQNFSIRLKLIGGFIVIIIFVLQTGLFSYLYYRQIIAPLSQEIPQAITDLSNISDLNVYAELIRYYDEALTQSARNYAFTQQEKWKQRYDQIVPELDTVIYEAIKKGDEEDVSYFSDVNDSNLALVDLEKESFRLVDAGFAEEAVEILESEEYWRLKEEYAQGIRSYVEKYEQAQQLSSRDSFEKIEIITNKAREVVIESYIVLFCLYTIIIIISLFLIYLIDRRIIRRIKSLIQNTKEIASGNLDVRTEVVFEDEMGLLEKSINIMTDKLVNSQKDIQKIVEKRTAEIEQLNKYLVGRELRMIELKKKLNEQSHEDSQ